MWSALLMLVPVVAAVEPVSISLGTIVTVLSTVMSVVSGLITVIKFVVYYTIFFAIVILIGIQFIPVVRSIDLVGLAQRLLGDSYRCKPAGPKASPTDTIPRQKQT